MMRTVLWVDDDMSKTAFFVRVLRLTTIVCVVPSVPAGHGCGLVARLQFDEPQSDYALNAVQKTCAEVHAGELRS